MNAPGLAFYVIGNHGSIDVDVKTGAPISYDDDPEPGDEPYSVYGIIRFDLDEYKAFWGVDIVPGDVLDICELGYWYRKPGDDAEQYEAPCDTMSRQEHASK